MIKEYIVPTSTAKFARANRNSYMVGALARFNNLFHDLCPEAREAAAKMGLTVSCHNSYAITLAQLAESIHFTVKAVNIIDQLLAMDINEEGYDCAGFTETGYKPGTGVGIVEAPRGTLIHEYSIDENGYITDANCIIPTGQNCGNIMEDMKSLLPDILDREREEIIMLLEMLARAYDPCISCSAHMLQLELR